MKIKYGPSDWDIAKSLMEDLMTPTVRVDRPADALMLVLLIIICVILMLFSDQTAVSVR